MKKDCIIQAIMFADLVPRDVLEAWLKYLRRSFPTLPFKASTQEQGRRLGRRGGRKGKMAPSLSQAELEGSPCVGAELLLSLLANYCRNKDIKTAITVGVVGQSITLTYFTWLCEKWCVLHLVNVNY